jgi:sec-independent protein translocase protein TatB
MSGIGFSELIILFLIGLIVLGPEKLPRVANQLGTWLGQARRMTRVMKRQLEEEIDLEGISKTIKQPFEQHTPLDDDTFSPRHEPATASDVEETITPATTSKDDVEETITPATTSKHDVVEDDDKEKKDA